MTRYLPWGQGRFTPLFPKLLSLLAAAYPPAEPLSVDQPVVTHGCAVTFWRYLPQHGPAPRPADLGHLLRQLHALGTAPFPLPVYQPLVSVSRAIRESQALTEDESGWLAGRCDRLLHAYRQLSFDLQEGMIHGDAWQGNLLRDGKRVVLADWDAVSIGPGRST